MIEPNKLFVYGILKRGFQLDLTKRGCKFIGEAQIQGANLYGIGHKWDGENWSGVGLRFLGLPVEDPIRVVHGEIFEIPDGPLEFPNEGDRQWYEERHRNLWDWLDGIDQNG